MGMSRTPQAEEASTPPVASRRGKARRRPGPLEERAPKQERSRATRDRICEATAQLLIEKPFQAISIQDIVEKASCSTSSFYSRFPSKLAVLHSLHQRAALDVRRSIEPLAEVGRSNRLTLAGVSQGVIRGYLAFRRRHAPVLRATRSLESQVPEILARREQMDREAFEAIKGALLRTLGLPRISRGLETGLENLMVMLAAAMRTLVDDPRHITFRELDATDREMERFAQASLTGVLGAFGVTADPPVTSSPETDETPEREAP